nr:hypothetical protein [uncultured Duganella sp.]
MNYDILDEHGNVINTIVAELEFVEAHYPGRYRAADGSGTPTTPTTPTEPTQPAVPESVPMLNAHLVIIHAGQMDALKALVAELPDQERQEAEAYLNLAQNCRRDNKWVALFGSGLGYDSDGLDQLFINAAALNP